MLRMVGFDFGHGENVLIDETLSGHGAVKAKQAFVTPYVRRARRQHGETHVRQKPFETDICYRGTLQQAAQKLVPR